MALNRFRQGGWIGTLNDDDEDLSDLPQKLVSVLRYYP